MHRALLKVAAMSGVCAAFLCVLLWLVAEIIDQKNSGEFSRGMRLLSARVIESGPPQETMPRLIAYRADNPLFSALMWVVTDKGEILASNTEEPLPSTWHSLPRPENIHDVTSLFRISAIRLDFPQPRYLVSYSLHPSIFYKNRIEKAGVGFLVMMLAGMTALSLVFYYLRRKSCEAKKVLRSLEKGDLKARFSIQRFDEVGNLMLDFNRMADEIERLVGQLREAENCRRLLMRELGHDLRTPLMSLQPSFDALVADWRVMRSGHREQILKTCQMEISYFAELVDGLLFIAQMDEPRYKTAAELVDLREVLAHQVRLQETGSRSSGESVQWVVENHLPVQGAKLLGDTQLLQRMIRNLFDNAARFAATRVTVKVRSRENRLCLQISDDGSGMTPEDIEQFGRVRNRRMSKQRDQSRLSLGLGSVIVRRIVELHQGRIHIRSHRAGDSQIRQGTLVEVEFPRARQS